MENLTIEKAQALLKELDPAMPERFTVLGVAYSKEDEAYYVRWFDEAEKDAYDDGVAQAKADGAKAAYSFTPTCSYSAVWFNEGDDGAMKPVASVLDPKDVADMRKGSKNLVLLDNA